jgi:hypothetical protein
MQKITFGRKKQKRSVCFATSCFQENWKEILLKKDYFKERVIQNHCYNFDKKILILNNFEDEEVLQEAIFHAKNFVKEGVITNYFLAKDYTENMLDAFSLKRDDFKAYDDNEDYVVSDDWVFYNALGPLISIYLCDCDYILHVTSDVYLEEKISWIEKAITLLEKRSHYFIANLAWNNKLNEVKDESYSLTKNFYVSDMGFSDQMFLAKTELLKKSIYNNVFETDVNFPRGSVFEKRVYCFMKKQQLDRITYRLGSYIHK